MEGNRVSDFSIERILSPQLGLRLPVMEFPSDGGYLQGGYGLDSGRLGPPRPVSLPVSLPVPFPGCLQYQGMGLGEAFYPYGPGFQHAAFSGVYPNSGVYVHLSSQDPADTQAFPGYHGYQYITPSTQAHPRQKARMRTVFTDSQTKQLEALFELTDYPAAESRAEVARNTGLSEETVRVWFKNRRARRKRQRSGSKVNSPSPPPYTGAEKKPFTFL